MLSWALRVRLDRKRPAETVRDRSRGLSNFNGARGRGSRDTGWSFDGARRYLAPEFRRHLHLATSARATGPCIDDIAVICAA